MAIITRLSRLFQADVHALLDQLEEPEALLKQSLREMELEVDAGKQRLADCHRQQQRQEQLLKSTDTALAELKPQLDLCFAVGDERLAKSLIRRRLELSQHARQLTVALKDLQRTRNELQNNLREQQVALDGLRQQAACFIGTEVQERDHHSSMVSADDVEVAFLAEKQARASGGVHRKSGNDQEAGRDDIAP